MRVLIVADDLSGAADCAAAAGTGGLVLLRPEVVADADIVAIDNDSRAASSEIAGQRVRTAIGALLQPDTAILYQKLDSTLRGNWPAELAALRRAVEELRGHAPLAVVAPALPEKGRTSTNARMFLGGQPLASTALWRAAGQGGDGDIVAMLAGVGVVATVLPAGETIEALTARMRDAADRGVDAVVCDAASRGDLNRIAAAGLALGQVLWVGSSGLMGSLAAQRPGSFAHNNPELMVSGPIVVVIGSAAAIAGEQFRRLRDEPGLVALEIAAETLRTGAGGGAPSPPLATAISAGHDVAIAIATGDKHDRATEGGLTAALAQHLAPRLPGFGGLVLTGGETARAMLDRAGVTAIRLCGEIEAGVPLGVTIGALAVPVVTKAGAFGTPESLVHALRALRAIRHTHGGNHQEDGPMKLPVVGITMGDAAGVGPEIIVKALAHADIYQRCRPLVIGDAGRLRQAATIVGSTLKIAPVEDVAAGRFELGTIDCIDLGLIPQDLPWGRLSPIAGDAAYQYIARAVELVKRQQIDAICTAPLNKEALRMGGHNFPGHTEMLAALTGTPEVSMMLMTPKLRVIHVTTHIGLLDAIARIEPGLVERTIRRGAEALRQAGTPAPRIGVCAINPHAGEHGLFGHGEEEEKIVPAIEKLRAEGFDIEGPLPADTLFFRAQRGDFDLVVAMYHDQGHGPVKVLGIEAGVNVTVGLPVIRTSVDHGTAFDIAGTGKADERSMLEALNQAIIMARRASPAPTSSIHPEPANAQ